MPGFLSTYSGGKTVKRIISIVIGLATLLVAAAYITDMPALRPVRQSTDTIIGTVPRPVKSSGNCSECESSCAGQFEKCKESSGGNSQEEGATGKRLDKCIGYYRACYFGCTGKYGHEKCPAPSVSNVF
jgi:hypothetical protein